MALFSLDDKINSPSSWMGVVDPHSCICATRALRYQRGILPKQSTTAQRSSNYLARYITGSMKLHGWSRSHGSHISWMAYFIPVTYAPSYYID